MTSVDDELVEFIAHRSQRLMRTAYALTHDRGVAEDLLQDALTKTWLAWSRIDGDPEPYLRRVMINTYTSWWRRRWRRETPTANLPEAASDDESIRVVDERERVWEALRQLPPRQHAVIVLRFYEDLSVEATAQILGCSSGTVKSQTTKALSKLRSDPQLGEFDNLVPRSSEVST